MRFYTTKHNHVCGVDLHARSLYLCIVDHESEQPLLHKNIRAEPAAFLDAVAPFRDDLVVGCEATFPWYWLADLCHDHATQLVLGHPLYMRAIHGAKVKNDRVDSKKIALLLRSGLLPRGLRLSQGLARHPRSAPATQLLHAKARRAPRPHRQHQQPVQPAAADCQARRRQEPCWRRRVLRRPCCPESVAADLKLIAHFDDVLRDLELTVLRSAREHAPQQLHLLRTVPGIGKILALNILYEVGEIHRFERVADFVSYCRLIRPDHTSAGKHVGFGPKKIGNTHLRWSFGEAAAGFPRKNPTGQRVVERLKRKYNKNAMNVLAHKLGRAVYFTAETQRGIRHQQTDELTDGGPPASPTPNWLLRVQPSAAAFFVASTTTRPHMAPGPSLSSLEWTPAVAPLFDNRRSRNA